MSCIVLSAQTNIDVSTSKFQPIYSIVLSFVHKNIVSVHILTPISQRLWEAAFIFQRCVIGIAIKSINLSKGVLSIK